jgi:DNA modification methylase
LLTFHRCLVVPPFVYEAMRFGRNSLLHARSAPYCVRDGSTGHWNGDRTQSTRWDIPSREDEGHGHGTQKPVESMARPMRNNSKRGDAIYEPFSGSGTTIIAGEMFGRRVFAMEIEPLYVDIAVARWEKFTGRKAIKADGESEGSRNADTAPEHPVEGALNV